MTYLELVNRLKAETGTAGNDLTTLTTPSREMQRLINWVAAAWSEIQLEKDDWEWMRKSMSFDTVINQAAYAPTTDILLTDFSHWRDGSFRIYHTASGVTNQILLAQTDYTSFRDYYLLGSRQITSARPIVITVAPDRSLILGLKPNDIYTVTGEYYKTPQVLTADGDIPDMPVRYHMAVVYKAMTKYGMFEAAQDQITAGDTQYRMLLNKMGQDQTPPILQGLPLI